MSNEVPIIKLGRHTFSTTTAAFAELSRQSEYGWAAQTRVANDPLLSFAGHGVETLTLPLIAHAAPTYGETETPPAGPLTLSALRADADRATPMILCDSTGAAHGQWVIKSIAETQKYFAPQGHARRIEFTITLQRYSRHQ